MAELRKMPSQAVPLIDVATGLMTPEWFLYFKSREGIGLGNLYDVSMASPANGDVLTYNSTSSKWENA